jgi:hypothetical protein
MVLVTVLMPGKMIAIPPITGPESRARPTEHYKTVGGLALRISSSSWGGPPHIQAYPGLKRRLLLERQQAPISSRDYPQCK